MRRNQTDYKDLTRSIEDYLKTIYKIVARQGHATVNTLARRMKVSAPSVTNMVKKMRAMGLVVHEPYGRVSLTPKGSKTALEIIRHHRLWELYLAKRLGIPLERVDAEAERLEHVLSDAVEEQMARLLGEPLRDPHGDPIPSKAGVLDSRPPGRKISDLRVGETSVVAHVSDFDPERLRAIVKLGLLPGVRFRLGKRPAESGSFNIQVGSKKFLLSRKVADLIRIT